MDGKGRGDGRGTGSTEIGIPFAYGSGILITFLTQVDFGQFF